MSDLVNTLFSFNLSSQILFKYELNQLIHLILTAAIPMKLIFLFSFPFLSRLRDFRNNLPQQKSHVYARNNKDNSFSFLFFSNSYAQCCVVNSTRLDFSMNSLLYINLLAFFVAVILNQKQRFVNLLIAFLYVLFKIFIKRFFTPDNAINVIVIWNGP